MKYLIIFFLYVLLVNPGVSRVLINLHDVGGAKVLIIQDELEQMEVLSTFLHENDEGVKIDIVDQDHLPGKISKYNVVILYLHFKLFETTEKKVIEFTKNGGRLIVLHHSISSGKAKNPDFFPFLGIQLDGTDKSNDPELPGAGYAWREGVTFTLVNLNPEHFVTTNQVEWGEKIYYIPSNPGLHATAYPTISLPDSEVYLNHKFIPGDDKVILMGLKFYDIRNDQLFMQDRASWYKSSGKGDIFYFMPGHSSLEFHNPNFSQMILNAINYPE
ncbi:ThuA domain-containing protein [Bacteroidota bacterium]